MGKTKKAAKAKKKQHPIDRKPIVCCVYIYKKEQEEFKRKQEHSTILVKRKTMYT